MRGAGARRAARRQTRVLAHERAPLRGVVLVWAVRSDRLWWTVLRVPLDRGWCARVGEMLRVGECYELLRVLRLEL